ncbi:hypothetical protein Acr_00g0099370 [Actinidia rufa]|uniref:Transposase (putative) gypsy type domain-containing protein n=1 Tax=Actinidia rufa TaxID=165716 RepID=A0A7J0E068_9ERIC|nr:hypothetical protein Acr_00g0099370 [Actinidia rufa]
MEDKVTRLPSSPREDPSSPESSPLAIFPLVKREMNVMTPEDLEQLRGSCSIPSSIQIRLPEKGETIMFARPSEVAFYKAAFHADLRLLIHPSIRMILHFYNICLAKLIPNAWCSVICAVVLWRYHKVALSLTEFRNLFGLYKNPKPDSGWLYFKARPKRTMFGEYHSKRCNKLLTLLKDKHDFLDNILSLVEGGNLYSVTVVLGSKTFCKSFGLLSKPMAFAEGGNNEDVPANGMTPVASDKAMSKRIGLKKLAQKVDESKSESSTINPTLAKGVVIGEKCSREDSITSPSKKGKIVESLKGKEVVPSPEAKKKVAKPRDTASIRATPILKHKEGTSPNLEKLDKLSLDQVVTKFFHAVRQEVVLGSFLEVQTREAGDEVTLQQGHQRVDQDEGWLACHCGQVGKVEDLGGRAEAKRGSF